MKRFIKSVIILGLLLLPCFSHAGLELVDEYTLDQHYNGYTFNKSGDLICVTLNSCNSYSSLTFMVAIADQNGGQDSSNAVTINFANQNNLSTLPKGLGYCTNTSWIKLYNGYDNETCNVTFSTYSASTMTSLQCQTEYNLIPISEVTKNYCELNFDLIDPLDCPSGGGSGTGVAFSNVYINSVMYPSSSDIYLNINERLSYDITYNTGLMYVDVYGYEGDEDYINAIIDVNSYRPSSEDFTNIFVGGLVRLFPFVVIALFIAFVRKFIRKIFK